MNEIKRLPIILDKLGIVGTYDTDLLTQAFVHRSYLNEHSDFPLASNERLEFLGDSVLSVIVSEHLYKTYANEPEGYLTAIRSAVVSKSSLARLAKDLELGTYLLLAHGEEEGGGRENPSLLADTLEALIGALHLSAGFEQTQRIVQHLFVPKIQQVVASGRYQDYKSMLQVHVQNRELSSPQYRVLSTQGPDHARHFQVGVYVNGNLVGRGTGRNKQSASQKAAKMGLRSLAIRQKP